ncbi:hypothetical protein MXB_104 [Myxobolus squamalis]|nr:hypothetical protein MXB_104 [Myxobolus squamalis]
MFVLSICLLISLASSKIYLHENFDDGYQSRWVVSEDKSVNHGELSLFQKLHCEDGDFSLKLMNDSSYYHITSKFDGVLDTTSKPLFLSYVFRYGQNIDCGGSYIKLFSELDQKKFTRDSPYSVMFGGDVCGSSDRKIHVIISHKGQNYPLKKRIEFSPDTLYHLLDLHLSTDRKYTVKFDGKVVSEGVLEDSFEYLPPKKIDDPSDKKPADWVDEETMVDLEDKKPADWDERRDIPDPDAKKPDDWDDSTDGEWERDQIKNVNYKGTWAPKEIPNPKYKGVWVPKQIDNPDYKPDDTFGKFPLSAAGFELWTVKSGTEFDMIIVTDEEKVALAHIEKSLEIVKSQNEKLNEEKKDDPSGGSINMNEMPEDKEMDTDIEPDEEADKDEEESEKDHEDL